MAKCKIKQHSAKRQKEKDKTNETRNETTLNEKNTHSIRSNDTIHEKRMVA